MRAVQLNGSTDNRPRTNARRRTLQTCGRLSLRRRPRRPSLSWGLRPDWLECPSPKMSQIVPQFENKTRSEHWDYDYQWLTSLSQRIREAARANRKNEPNFGLK